MKHAFPAALAALLSLCALSGAAVAQEPSFLDDASSLDDASPFGDVTGPAVLEAPAPAPAGPVERYFILLFDSPLGGIRQLDEVSAAVEEWLAHELLPTDAAAVVSYYGQELRVAQDFTRDRQALATAVGAAVRGQDHASAPAETGSPSLLARLPAEQDLAHRAASFYGALQVIAGTVDSVPGPKGLLVFSKGFGRSRLPGGAGGFAFSDVLAGPDLSLGETLAESPVVEKYLPEPSLFEPTLEALVSRQIRLYPVDLATDYSEAFPLAGVMSRLASETGGRYVYPATELPRILMQVAQTDRPAGDRQAEQIFTPSPSGGRGAQTE